MSDLRRRSHSQPTHSDFNSEADAMLAGIGPQSSSDSSLMARVRFHQSWFRYHVLKLADFGCTRGGRPIGSILTTSDGERGKNFVTPEAHALFRIRHQEG